MYLANSCEQGMSAYHDAEETTLIHPSCNALCGIRTDVWDTGWRDNRCVCFFERVQALVWDLCARDQRDTRPIYARHTGQSHSLDRLANIRHI